MDGLDSMDDLIGLLNNKNYDPLPKSRLKPIIPGSKIDEEFLVKEDEEDEQIEQMPTQKHFYKFKPQE
jgi:hypothetical protein